MPERIKRISLKAEILISENFAEIQIFRDGKEIARKSEKMGKDESFDSVSEFCESIISNILKAMK